jgi:hypothetical protein
MRYRPRLFAGSTVRSSASLHDAGLKRRSRCRRATADLVSETIVPAACKRDCCAKLVAARTLPRRLDVPHSVQRSFLTRWSRRRSDLPTARLTKTRSSASEYDRRVVVTNHSVFAMPLDCPCKHRPFDLGTDPGQLLDGMGVRHPCHILLDDRSRIQLRSHGVRLTRRQRCLTPAAGGTREARVDAISNAGAQLPHQDKIRKSDTSDSSPTGSSHHDCCSWRRRVGSGSGFTTRAACGGEQPPCQDCSDGGSSAS